MVYHTCIVKLWICIWYTILTKYDIPYTYSEFNYLLNEKITVEVSDTVA